MHVAQQLDHSSPVRTCMYLLTKQYQETFEGENFAILCLCTKVSS